MGHDVDGAGKVRVGADDHPLRTHDRSARPGHLHGGWRERSQHRHDVQLDGGHRPNAATVALIHRHRMPNHLLYQWRRMENQRIRIYDSRSETHDEPNQMHDSRNQM